MFFERIYEKGLAQASYIIGCQVTNEAIVIDPNRDTEIYIQIAKREKLRISHITETHIHADFLSGSLELANATGAKIYLSDEGGVDWQYQFDHIGLKDGDSILVGNLILKVIHTPGHTPEHISFLLIDQLTSPEPIMIFTGDFVFVGDVGRPDLLEKAAGIEGTMIQSSKQLFQSLQKFKLLSDHIQLWPGHGAGSACGKSLGSVPSSTIGYEKLSNWALKINEEDTFIQNLLEDQPEPPKYFDMMKKLNKADRKLIRADNNPVKLSFSEFQKAYNEGYQIVDTRDHLSFSKEHIQGSIYIKANNSFSTWAGWMLDYNKPAILITPENRVDFLRKALHRIGMDNFSGYISDIESLIASGLKVESSDNIASEELNEKFSAYKIIDVRNQTEYKISHLPSAINIHTGFLEKNLNEISRAENIVVYCSSGERSSIAASFLQKNGYKNVFNLIGGINSWIDTGFKVESNYKEELTSIG